MKTLFLSGMILLTSISGLRAQGLVTFSNAPWEAWQDRSCDYCRYVCYPGTYTLVDDPTWSVGLFEGWGSSAVQLGDRCNFFGPDIAGVWQWDGVQRVAHYSTLHVRLYDGAGNLVAVSREFDFTKGSSVPPSPTDTLMHNFRGICVAEPSTVTLGLAGLAVLLVFRPRKGTSQRPIA